MPKLSDDERERVCDLLVEHGADAGAPLGPVLARMPAVDAALVNRAIREQPRDVVFWVAAAHVERHGITD